MKRALLRALALLLALSAAACAPAETQEEAEKIIYQHINPVYACDLGIGELEPGKNYESIYIPVQCFR